MNSKGFLSYGTFKKLFAVILIVIGLIPFLYDYGAVGFNLPFFVLEYSEYILGLGGLIIFFGCFGRKFLGRKNYSLIAGLIALGISAYLIAVELNYITAYFILGAFWTNVLFIIFGAYILMREFI